LAFAMLSVEWPKLLLLPDYVAKKAAHVTGWLFKPTAFNHHYNEAGQ
jgi:hypothetical protein